MDFVEYLELIVRLAFVIHKTTGAQNPSPPELMRTLTQVVTDML